MSAQNDDPRPDDHTVEADEDPKVVEIERIESAAEEETRFAQAEARFAHWEEKVGEDRIHEGANREGKALIHDAASRMDDAADVMAHVDRQEHDAERLRNEKRQELSHELREWTGQSLVTLADAVRGVRTHVEQMSDHDMRKIVRASNLSEDDVARNRTRIIEYGQSIEITLNSVTEVRRDPLSLVQALGAFTTLAFELARYLPSLMQKLEEFGRLLAQFHF